MTKSTLQYTLVPMDNNNTCVRCVRVPIHIYLSTRCYHGNNKKEKISTCPWCYVAQARCYVTIHIIIAAQRWIEEECGMRCLLHVLLRTSDSEISQFNYGVSRWSNSSVQESPCVPIIMKRISTISGLHSHILCLEGFVWHNIIDRVTIALLKPNVTPLC